MLITTQKKRKGIAGSNALDKAQIWEKCHFKRHELYRGSYGKRAQPQYRWSQGMKGGAYNV